MLQTVAGLKLQIENVHLDLHLVYPTISALKNSTVQKLNLYLALPCSPFNPTPHTPPGSLPFLSHRCRLCIFQSSSRVCVLH